ncbi:MAG: M23 family metallopeptidase [Nevskiaceae bacterium]|nr:MAG: M23 family metallopeptidase [Nevskiaceae bacterium]TBR72061.1 MAG: M23 family metallopeptidase [Nevskiaceae bacterium]
MRLPGVWAALLAVVMGSFGAAQAADLGDGVSLQGKWQQGALLLGHAPQGTQVTFDGQALSLTPYGTFVIGLDRDEKGPAHLQFTVPGKPAKRWDFTVAKRTWRIQRINGMNKSQTTFAPDVLARIQREAGEIRAARATASDQVGFAQHFQWPVTGRISSVFGSQRILDGTPRQPHYGVDIAVPTGTPVKAPAAGVVSFVAQDLYFTGATLMVDHGHGVQSVFAHLSRIDVKPGQFVKQGEVIAHTGATGRATGPNLHWGVSWFERHVDAARLAGPMPRAGRR